MDVWRLFAAGTSAGIPAVLPFAPPRVEAMQYVNPATGHTVVSALDPVLAHKWPDWNYMGTIWDFFQHVPTR